MNNNKSGNHEEKYFQWQPWRKNISSGNHEEKIFSVATMKKKYFQWQPWRKIFSDIFVLVSSSIPESIKGNQYIVKELECIYEPTKQT